MTTEKFRFKLLTTGKAEVDKRKPCDFKPINLEILLEWINSQNIDEAIKVELIKSASNYPHQALKSWKRNFPKHVTTAWEKIKKSKFNEKKDLNEESTFDNQENTESSENLENF